MGVWLRVVLGVAMFIVCWVVLLVKFGGQPFQLEMEVKQVAEISYLEGKWLYAALHLFIVLPVLSLSFDKKVHYYTYWRSLIPAIGIVAAGFILWDAVFSSIGVWGFNDAYITGTRIWGLPWEECMFFISVPFASFFIQACLDSYFPTDPLQKWDKAITLVLAMVLLVFGLWFVQRLYTSVTFLLTGFFLLYHYKYIPNTYRTRFFRAYVVILIPFLLSNGLLTGAFTKNPVVVYNVEAFMGLRIRTIPLEDAVYGFLLIFGVATLQQVFSKKNENKFG